MHFGRILEGVWDEQINAKANSGHDAVRNLLHVMLPVHSVLLSQAGNSADRVMVLTDDCYVAPDLPLGDLLAQELDIDVPQQSLVCIIPERVVSEHAARTDISAAIGQILAQSVGLLAERGQLSLEHEIATIRSLAEFYHNLAGSNRLAELGLQASTFRAAYERELEALVGCSIRKSVDAAACAPLTNAHALFSAQLDAFAGCGRWLTRCHFADLAVRFANSVGSDASKHVMENRV